MGHRGPKKLDPSHPLSKLPAAAKCFGDDSVGVLGILDPAGLLTLMIPVPKLPHLSPSLACPETLAVPISHMAMDGNGRVAVVLRKGESEQNIEEPLMTVLEFPSFYATPTSATNQESFSDWIARVQTSYATTEPAVPISQPPMHTLQGTCTQLLGNKQGFLLRTHTGFIYTWSHTGWGGIARDFYYCLKPGGTVQASLSDYDVLATTPGLTDFEGLYSVDKLSSRGLLSIALTPKQYPLYNRAGTTTMGLIWGDNVFGSDPIPEKGDLNGLLDDMWDSPAEYAIINLSSRTDRGFGDTRGDLELVNDNWVVDVCAGHAHVLVTDDEGQVWSAGRNQYGQLGRPVLDAEAGCDVSWAKVRGLEDTYASQAKVVELSCGRTTSFVVVRRT